MEYPTLVNEPLDIMDLSAASLHSRLDMKESSLLLEDYGRRTSRAITVRFPAAAEDLAQTVEEVINREDLTEEDREALWWSSEEYAVLKQESRLEAIRCEREAKCNGKGLLDDVFLFESSSSKKSSSKDSQPGIPTRQTSKDNKSSQQKSSAQDKLIQWVRDTPERRGLERSASPALGDARQQAQFQAVMDVLRSQDEMLISKGRVDPEQVRKVSVKATRSARQFARMLAKADAVAVGADPGRDPFPNHHKRRKSKTSSLSMTASSSHDKAKKEKKEERKAKKKVEKAKEKEEKLKSKEEKQKAKESRRKDKEAPKPKTSFKQKIKETLAGNKSSRMPRIA